MSVSVSQKSILLTILGILVVVVFWQLRTLVLSLLLSYILMAGLRPVVFRTQRIFRIGYSGASAVVYFSSIIILITLLAAFVGPLVSQFQMFVTNLPNIAKALASYAENLSLGITTSQAQTAIVPLFEQLVGRIISLTLGSVSLFLFSVSVFVTTFYLLLEHDGAAKYLVTFFPGNEKRILAVEAEVERRVGFWVLAQIIIAFLVGVVTLLGLLVFQINYFLPLSLLAFLLSPVVGVGPLLATIPAVIVATVQSPILGVWIFVYYNVVQTIKDNFVVPKLMSSKIGLDPFIILFVLLVGLSLFGFLGAIVSVPTAVGIGVVVEELMRKDA